MNMKKIIYASVDLSGINIETATKDKEDALQSICNLVQKIAFIDFTGTKISIEVELDEWAYGSKCFATASASKTGPSKFKIKLGVGLIAQLRVIAMAIAADKSVLKGRTKTRLLSKDCRHLGREKAIGDFVFHFMVSFIFWHEVSHIALGHLDWLSGNGKFSALDEFGEFNLTDQECLERRVLEGDADRQAAKWTAGIIDYALNANPYLRYPSIADTLFDVGYIFGALFSFLDSIDAVKPENRIIHPRAQIRMGIALSFVEDFLEKYYPDASSLLQAEVYRGGAASLKNILHENQKPFDAISVASFIVQNRQELEKLGIRKFQHKPQSHEQNSFIFL